MLSHVFLGTNQFERVLSFYRPVMKLLRLHERFFDPTCPWAGWEIAPNVRSLFLLGRPYNGDQARVSGVG